MQSHEIKRVHKNKISRQVARGGKRGKTAGRGTKGQNSRSGRKKRPEMRDIIKKIPKLRGRGRNSFLGFQVAMVPVNFEAIEKHFSGGDDVNPETLVAKGLIEMYKGGFPPVKILAEGELTKKVTVSGCAVSAPAKAKIEKAGGMVK